MNQPNSPGPLVRTTLMGRRWTIALVALLTLNTTLVAWAINDYVGAGQPRQGDDTVATVVPANADESASPPADIEVAQTPQVPLDSAPSPVEPSDPPPSPSVAPSIAVTTNPSPAGHDVVPSTVTATAGDVGAEQVTPMPSTGEIASSSPPAPAATPQPEPPTSEPQPEPQASPAVIVVNPPQTRGVVHYLIDGVVVSLLPGEYQRLDGPQSRQIAFHRGDEFEDCQSTLGDGVHVFQVGENGWELTQPPAASARRLIETCRALTSQD